MKVKEILVKSDMFKSVKHVAKGGLLLLIAGLPLSVNGAQQAYTMTGFFDDPVISDVDGFGSTTDNVALYDGPPLEAGDSFTLSFILDDQAAQSSTYNSPHSVGATYGNALTGLSLSVNGEIYWQSPVEDVGEYIHPNASGNHQWSFFGFNGSLQNGGELIEVLEVEDQDLNPPEIVDELSFGGLSLFLLDTDSALFTQSPPELTTFDGSEFDLSWIELNWFGQGVDPSFQSLYDMSINGQIDNIAVSSVPLPAAFWLFGSVLLALMPVARRRN